MKTKSKGFLLRLTSEEHDALHKLAALEDISASAYLRDHIHKGAKRKGIKI